MANHHRESHLELTFNGGNKHCWNCPTMKTVWPHISNAFRLPKTVLSRLQVSKCYLRGDGLLSMIYRMLFDFWGIKHKTNIKLIDKKVKIKPYIDLNDSLFL